MKYDDSVFFIFSDDMEFAYNFLGEADDIEYIQTIMFGLPDSISQLFFPIVIPNSHLISYKAINQNHSILIVDDTIDLVP